MFAKLRLKNRLLLGYAIPVVLFLGATGIVYSIANKILEAFQEVERVQEAIITTDTMALSGQGMISAARGYLINKDEDYITRYQAYMQEFEEAASAAEKVIKDPQQQQRFQKMIQLVKDYDEFAQEMLKLKGQGKQEEMLALFSTGKGKEVATNFFALNDEFNQTEIEKLEKQNGQAKEALQLVLLGLAVGAILTVAIAIIAAWVISAGVAQTIGQATNAIASSATEIAATVEEQERISSQQAASVNQTTTTMDELGASSRQAATQAEWAVAGALKVLALVEGGLDRRQLIEGGKSSLKDKVDAIAQQIIHLSQQTGQIGNISNVVSELASQTNMLALNAAVEAVRAGEHGKGFAVVAAEIRKLADQSKKSAQDINTLVADIQTAVNSTVIVTEDGKKTLQGAVSAINEIVANNQQISLTAKQQSVAIQQVVEAMNSINSGAQQTASGISQTKVGTQSLNEAALNLKTLV